MYAVIVEMDLSPTDATEGALRKMLELTRSFEGNIRVDVLADPEDPTRWLLYELWEDRAHQEAYIAHRRDNPTADDPLAGMRGDKPTVLRTYDVRN